MTIHESGSSAYVFPAYAYEHREVTVSNRDLGILTPDLNLKPYPLPPG